MCTQPATTEAFHNINKQVCSLSEQVAHLQLIIDGMMQPLLSHLPAEHVVLTASCSISQPACLDFAVEVHVGLLSSWGLVREAVEQWFELCGFPAPRTLCQQAVQCGQWPCNKAIDNMSKHRHLPLQIQAPTSIHRHNRQHSTQSRQQQPHRTSLISACDSTTAR